jgi:hypothetical protein
MLDVGPGTALVEFHQQTQDANARIISTGHHLGLPNAGILKQTLGAT